MIFDGGRVLRVGNGHLARLDGAHLDELLGGVFLVVVEDCDVQCVDLLLVTLRSLFVQYLLKVCIDAGKREVL